MNDKYNTQYDGINKFIKSVIGMKQQNNNSHRRKKNRRKRYQFKKNFVKSIERRTVRRLLLLSKKEASDQLWNLPPLRKTDKFLEGSKNLNDSFLNRSIDINEAHFPEAYINTAIILLQIIIMTNNNGIRDGLIYPALFSFRHYLELTMKDSLNHFNNLHSSHVVKEVQDRDHNLKNLWKALLPHIGPGEDMDIMQKLIYEVNNIDPTSEIFRYPYEIDDNGNKRLPHIDQTRLNDVVKLKRVMLKMYRFMDGINWLAHEGVKRKI